MGEHTPGPWELQENGAAFNLRSPDRCDHFMILLGMTHNNPGELEANVRLIAASETLLEVCESFAVWLIAPDLSAETLAEMRDKAEAAIAKATPTKSE